MHSLRHGVALRTTEGVVLIFMDKHVLQLVNNFIFELRALVGVECLGVVQRYQIPFRQELSCPEGRPAQQIE